MVASYEKFNYAIRPNKRTQRKLIFDILGRYVSIFPTVEFGYVGFGSMWFSDFLYAHRHLGIRRLTSIELPRGYKRAVFNKPFRCIRVLEGDSNNVLPLLDWSRPAIVWLDYDYPPGDESLQDLAFLASTLVSPSVIMATFDARPPWKDADSWIRRQDAVRRVFGDAAPPNLRKRLADDAYPSLEVDLLWRHIENAAVTSGRTTVESLSVHPLFSFTYKDGAPMVTLAGSVLSPADKEAVLKARLDRRLEHARGKELVRIAIPPVTPKERTELDRRLPMRGVKVPFGLDRDIIDAYSAFYRYYPLFAEVDL